jgi:hypothetical protein
VRGVFNLTGGRRAQPHRAGTSADEADLVFHPVFVVASVGSLIITNETYHKVLAPLGAIIYLVCIALLSTALR